MTDRTFKELRSIRNALVQNTAADVSGIFVPWAGSQLKADGCIYYVGVATDGDFGAGEPQTLSACYQRSAELCNGKRHARSHTPFWQFLDGLSVNLLGGPYEQTCHR